MEGSPFKGLMSGVTPLATTEGGGTSVAAASLAGALEKKIPTIKSQAANFNDGMIQVRTTDGGMSGYGSIYKGMAPAPNWNIQIDTTGLSTDSSHTIRLFDNMEAAACYSTCQSIVPDGVVKMNGSACQYEQLLRWMCGSTSYLIKSIRFTVTGTNDNPEDVDQFKNSRIWTYGYDEAGHRQEGSFDLALHNDPGRYNSDIMDVPTTGKWSVISSNVGWELRDIPANLKINMLFSIIGRFRFQ